MKKSKKQQQKVQQQRNSQEKLKSIQKQETLELLNNLIRDSEENSQTQATLQLDDIKKAQDLIEKLLEFKEANLCKGKKELIEKIQDKELSQSNIQINSFPQSVLEKNESNIEDMQQIITKQEQEIIFLKSNLVSREKIFQEQSKKHKKEKQNVKSQILEFSPQEKQTYQQRQQSQQFQGIVQENPLQQFQNERELNSECSEIQEQQKKNENYSSIIYQGTQPKFNNMDEQVGSIIMELDNLMIKYGSNVQIQQIEQPNISDEIYLNPVEEQIRMESQLQNSSNTSVQTVLQYKTQSSILYIRQVLTRLSEQLKRLKEEIKHQEKQHENYQKQLQIDLQQFEKKEIIFNRYTRNNQKQKLTQVQIKQIQDQNNLEKTQNHLTNIYLQSLHILELNNPDLSNGMKQNQQQQQQQIMLEKNEVQIIYNQIKTLFNEYQNAASKISQLSVSQFELQETVNEYEEFLKMGLIAKGKQCIQEFQISKNRVNEIWDKFLILEDQTKNEIFSRMKLRQETYFDEKTAEKNKNNNYGSTMKKWRQRYQTKISDITKQVQSLSAFQQEIMTQHQLLRVNGKIKRFEELFAFFDMELKQCFEEATKQQHLMKYDQQTFLDTLNNCQ